MQAIVNAAPYAKAATLPARLFVIAQRGRDLYWSCSTEHGCGWTPHHPKQAFSPSELGKEIRRLIDEGWWADCEVFQLRIQR